VSYPSPGQPWQPDQPQSPYGGGQPGGPAPQSGPAGPSWPDQYGGDPNYGQQPYSGGPGYRQESYTTEPPYSGGPAYDQGYGASQPGYDQGYAQQPGYPQAPQSYPPAPQPGYQQPGYPQPGYGQPGYGQPGYPGQQPARGRGGLIAVIAGVAVLVLLLCGVGGVVLLNSDTEPDVNTDPTRGVSSGPTSSASSTKAAGNAEYPARLTLPATVAGMPRLNNAQLDQTANQTATKLKSSLNADSAIAGYYAPTGDPSRAVGLVGVTTKLSNPDAELKAAFNSTLNVTDVQEVQPGPLGGVMRCGNTSSAGSALTVCGWADGGSLVLGIFVNRSLTDSATVFRQIRSEILVRG
jgi:hypothetical protein